MSANQKKKKIETIVGNKFFTVFFRKRDNTWRTLNGRLGVKSYRRGGERTVGDHVIVVWDRMLGEYRSFYPDSVAWVKCRGRKFSFKSHSQGTMSADNYKARKAA